LSLGGLRDRLTLARRGRSLGILGRTPDGAEKELNPVSSPKNVYPF